MSDKNKTFMNEKLIPKIMWFVNLKAIVALKDGILFTMPLIIVGSVLLLITQFPWTGFTDFMASVFGEGWTVPLSQAQNASFGIIAIVAAIGIAYTYVKNEGFEPLSAGVLSLVVFLIATPSTAANADGAIIDSVIPKAWTGGKGMITAIIVGLLVGYLYSLLLKKDIKIKMPEGVPQGVVNAFSALLPASIVILGAMFVYIFFSMVTGGTFVEWIYEVIQTPLQGLSDSLGAVIVITFIIPFLWMFGVHGSTIVGGIMDPLLIANAQDNQAIIDAGKELTIANGAHIVTHQFLNIYINMTGAGVTIGLVIAMLLFAKSAQFKQLGKLTILPGLFNINEPVLFGTPIVANPFMIIPFIGVPMLTGILLYLAIRIGLVPPFSGVMPPWTTPPIISGFMSGGWRAALFQAFEIVLSVAIYLPFFKKQDAMTLEMEKQAVKA